MCTSAPLVPMRAQGFGRDKAALDQKVDDIMEIVGLPPRLKYNYPNQLSGGQRQALTLLMTVMSRPDILMLDEHTAALDPRNAAMVMEQTTRFIDRDRLTTLMITHNMGHAIEFGNRLVMMDSGEIIIDVKGDEKKKLTKNRLIEMFSEIKHQEFDSDEVLLTP